MFDKNKVKLGIAPIAWTNDDLPDLGKENGARRMYVDQWSQNDAEDSGDNASCKSS